MPALLDDLLTVAPEQADAAIDALTEAQAEALLYDWFGTWARDNQQPPAWDWRVWLILAGRGYGKTRAGAEMVRWWVRRYPLVNIIGATADDARDIMVTGESGILACCPRAERPVYRASQRRLDWPNGAKTLIFTADEPERLRGKQGQKLWADELGAWRYSEAWDQAMLGLRLGDNPQAIVTTTPKPNSLIRGLVWSNPSAPLGERLPNPTTAVTTGTTYENRANLAPQFYAEIISKYEGTRLGRQELGAELLEDIEGALWTHASLDALRVREAPPLTRVVVAVDPSGTSGEDADEVGIVVAGKGEDGHGYVLADLSGRFSPDQWARRAVEAYHRFEADRLVAEVNYGGDMVEHTLRTVDRRVAYRKLIASRGKHVRAEPIAALSEQSRVHMVGTFPALEDELCAFTSAGYEGAGSPGRADAYVWAMTELFERGTPKVL